MVKESIQKADKVDKNTPALIENQRLINMKSKLNLDRREILLMRYIEGEETLYEKVY